MNTQPEPPDKQELVRRCAWCGRTPVDGIWIDAATLSAHEATHGICPDCFDAQEQRRRTLTRAARAYRRRRPKQ